MHATSVLGQSRQKPREFKITLQQTTHQVRSQSCLHEQCYLKKIKHTLPLTNKKKKRKAGTGAWECLSDCYPQDDDERGYGALRVGHSLIILCSIALAGSFIYVDAPLSCFDTRSGDVCSLASDSAPFPTEPSIDCIVYHCACSEMNL